MRPRRMKVGLLLATLVLAGSAPLAAASCAQGGEEAQTEPADSAPPRVDSTTDASIDEVPVDANVPEGAPIFDSFDEAPCSPGATTACTTGCGTPGDSTCVSGEWGPCKPKPGDPCTGLDCKGKGDGLEHLYFRDSDGDGHGVPAETKASCAPAPAGWAASTDDCDDGNAAVYPGAPEKCDLVDDDCNGKCDEGSGCRVGVHRSYRPGEHFYTSSLTEAKCCGFTVEAENFFYLYTASATGLTQLYRCIYSTGNHFYTTDSTCEGSASEGPIGWIATSATCGATALYRLELGGGDHFYCTDPAERTYAVSLGYVDKGITGYVWKAPTGG